MPSFYCCFQSQKFYIISIRIDNFFKSLDATLIRLELLCAQFLRVYVTFCVRLNVFQTIQVRENLRCYAENELEWVIRWFFLLKIIFISRSFSDEWVERKEFNGLFAPRIMFKLILIVTWYLVTAVSVDVKVELILFSFFSLWNIWIRRWGGKHSTLERYGIRKEYGTFLLWTLWSW